MKRLEKESFKEDKYAKKETIYPTDGEILYPEYFKFMKENMPFQYQECVEFLVKEASPPQMDKSILSCGF